MRLRNILLGAGFARPKCPCRSGVASGAKQRGASMALEPSWQPHRHRIFTKRRFICAWAPAGHAPTARTQRISSRPASNWKMESRAWAWHGFPSQSCLAPRSLKCRRAVGFGFEHGSARSDRPSGPTAVQRPRACAVSSAPTELAPGRSRLGRASLLNRWCGSAHHETSSRNRGPYV